MRRPLGALLCLGSLTALGTPIATAHAAAAPQVACRVYAAKPHVTAAGTIQASASRLGCDDTALLRVHIKRAVAGTDPIVKSAAQKRANGWSIANLRCTPGVYYTAATDHQGNEDRSKAVRLSCTTDTPTPAPTPAPTPTPTPSAGTALKPASAAPGSAQWPSIDGRGRGGAADQRSTRQATGCGPLIHDVQLHSVAQDHSTRHGRHQQLLVHGTHSIASRRAASRRCRSGGKTPHGAFPPRTRWSMNWMKEDDTPINGKNSELRLHPRRGGPTPPTPRRSPIGLRSSPSTEPGRPAPPRRILRGGAGRTHRGRRVGAPGTSKCPDQLAAGSATSASSSSGGAWRRSSRSGARRAPRGTCGTSSGRRRTPRPAPWRTRRTGSRRGSAASPPWSPP